MSSRIRIYELAKEAGLKSKELADRLIAMGYPIKSLSSTVDDDMAAEIRRKVLGKATAEITGKPISVKKKVMDVEKKAKTIVRRRSRAQKEEIAQKAEEAKIADTAAREQRNTEHEIKNASVAQQTQEDAPADEAGKQVSVEAIGEQEIPDTHTTPAAAADNKKAASKPVQKEPKRAKGLARIVGKVDIPVDKREKKPVRRPRPQGAKSTKGPSGSTNPPASTPGQDPAAKGKNRKKGRRVVAVNTEEANRTKKAGKTARKSRQRVNFSNGNSGDFNNP
ncbi:MAG: hypothetical protein D3923_07225, partial [Candidatus Electrothrix sp. AR3]|nr:hypothetical protein [Candidatus Electrothrix sp. AR3]